MKIKEKDSKINYIRHIESMGKGLILFKVKVEKKQLDKIIIIFMKIRKNHHWI